MGSWKDLCDPRGRSFLLGVYGGKGLPPGRCAPLQQILLLGPQPELGAKTTNYSRRTADFWHSFHFAPPPLLVSLASFACAFAAPAAGEAAVKSGTRREADRVPGDKGCPPPFPPTKVLSPFDASVVSCGTLESGGALHGLITRP